MSCPNCQCAACSAERLRWQKQPDWFAPVPTPWVYEVPPGPGYWKCACGQWHPPGYMCITIGSTSKPDINT